MTEKQSVFLSKYNRLIVSEHHGRFLYNALSNVLLEVDAVHFELLRELLAGGEASPAMEDAFLKRLREIHVLVDPDEETDQLLILQYRRQAASYDSSTLGLAICPTLHCNFACPYCYESGREASEPMSAKTMERLMGWIAERPAVRELRVLWYGGEPLLAFDVIETLTAEFQSTGLNFRNASLVTNGYYLDARKIARLNELNITSVQVTLDGPADVHDSRRTTIEGGATFAHILANVETLMASDYAGRCMIRVNVDRSNAAGYAALRADLLQRFKNRNFGVYPGMVQTSDGQGYSPECCLNTADWAEFNLALYREHSVLPPGGFHPQGAMEGLCSANRMSSFVVGPDGALYKCWEDVGRAALSVGSLFDAPSEYVSAVAAQYVVGTDPYNDPECRACDVLPVCGGGCAVRRRRYQRSEQRERDFCSPLKEHLDGYLEAYVDGLRTTELCAGLLQPGKPGPTTAWRVISPRLRPPPSEPKEKDGRR